MDINDLFENIAKIINMFADEIVAERAHNKMPMTGRGQESEGKNSETFSVRDRSIRDKIEKTTRGRNWRGVSFQ